MERSASAVDRTAGRLNRAKNQYENLLLSLHQLPHTTHDSKDDGDLIYFPTSSSSRGQQHLSVAAAGEMESFEGEGDVEDIIVNQQVTIEFLRSELAELRLLYETDVLEAQRRQEEAERFAEEEVTRLTAESVSFRSENQQLKVSLAKSVAEAELYKQQLDEALHRIFRLSHSSFKSL